MHQPICFGPLFTHKTGVLGAQRRSYSQGQKDKNQTTVVNLSSSLKRFNKLWRTEGTSQRT